MTYDEWYATPEGKAQIDADNAKQHAFLDTVRLENGIATREEFDALDKGERITMIVARMEKVRAAH